MDMEILFLVPLSGARVIEGKAIRLRDPRGGRVGPGVLPDQSPWGLGLQGQETQTAGWQPRASFHVDALSGRQFPRVETQARALRAHRYGGHSPPVNGTGSRAHDRT